jgi:hypothetical protein
VKWLRVRVKKNKKTVRATTDVAALANAAVSARNDPQLHFLRAYHFHHHQSLKRGIPGENPKFPRHQTVRLSSVSSEAAKSW